MPATDSLAPQYPIESVDNALKLLLLLGEQSQIRLSEATRYLGVASSTAHRLLAMLTYRGFVRQDPVSKAYLPGPALTSVAFAIFGRIDVQATATPIMRSLSERLRESIHVGMLDGASVHFVAAVEGPTAVRVASRLGRTMPAHCTSTGKVMLAQLSQPELHQLLPDEELAAHYPALDRQPHRIGSRAFPHPRTGLRRQSRGERGRRRLGCGSDTDPGARPAACAQRRSPAEPAGQLPVLRSGRCTCQGGQGDWRSTRLSDPAGRPHGARPPRR